MLTPGEQNETDDSKRKLNTSAIKKNQFTEKPCFKTSFRKMEHNGRFTFL